MKEPIILLLIILGTSALMWLIGIAAIVWIVKFIWYLN